MRPKNQASFKYAVLAAASAAALFGLAACGSSDSTTPVQVPSTPPVQALTSAAKYQLVLRNAATGALITDSVAVTLSGAGTVNMSGAATTSFTTTDGLVAFASAPGVAAGGTIRVATQSRAAGWTDGDAVVTINASDAVQNVEIRLTNITRVAEIPASVPVAAAAASVATTGGATTAVVAATTAPKVVTTVTGGTTTLAPASVSIAAGTRITNAAGQTPTGPLQVTVVAPSLDTAEGRAAIPGTTSSAGQTLQPAGLVTMLMTDSTGARFTNFGTPVTSRMPLAAGTLKADDSGPLAAGDSYPVYVWNPTTNQFTFQTNGTVVSTPNGLVLEFPTNSFSTRVAARVRPPTFTPCTSTVNFTGRPAGNTDPVSVQFLSAYGSDSNVGGVTGNSATAPNVQLLSGNVTLSPASVVVRNASGALLGVATSNNACPSVTVPLTFPTPPTGSIVVSTREQCADGSNNRALPTNVSAVTGTATPRSAYSTGGAATIAGLPAGNYTVTATGVGGRANITQSVTVGTGAVNANFLFPLTCTTGTGGG